MPDFRTDTQKLVDALREAILRHEIPAGERLPQRKIAERYSTTTIVAREALRILSSEGLVIIEPRFGAMVEEITQERLEGRYIVREALEGMAARLAARSMSMSTRDQLMLLAKECDRELPGERLSNHEKAELHIRLHKFIASLSRCDELVNVLGNIYLKSIIVSNAYRVDWQKDEYGWHTRLCDAIVTDDPEQAEAMMREHVRRGRDMEIAAIGAGSGQLEGP